MACEICQRPTHEWYDCPKKLDGYVPLARREHKELQVVALHPQSAGPETSPGRVEGNADGQPIRKPGRPIMAEPKSKRAEYMRDYMSKRRLKLKEGK